MKINNNMKRVFLIYGVLFVVLFQFISCLSNDERNPVYFFYDEPVVVSQMGVYPFICNDSYSFYVPELSEDTTLKVGDLLWSSFIVDLDDKDYPSVLSTFNYTAKNFRYQYVESSKVIIPTNVEEFKTFLSDDFSEPVELSVLYRYTIDSLWFLGFKHKDNSNQLHYTYELILNPEIENSSNNYPTLYIRSKQINSTVADQAKDEQGRKVFSFDVADFANYYREEISSNELVKFNLKYKTGVDSNGDDIYKEFMSNPMTWKF